MIRNSSLLRRQKQLEQAEATLLALLGQACQSTPEEGPVVVFVELGIPQ